MKEKIYTIPLNEAFDENTECVFCSLYSSLEEKAIDYTLGPSYMEPDVRLETNRLGFCSRHLSMMFDNKNRLGLSLMMSSHYEEIIKHYDEYYAAEYISAKKSLFKNKNSGENFIEKINSSCFICEKINSDMNKFYDTFVYMWNKDEEFRKKVINSKAFCLNHFDKIVKVAYQKMNKAEFDLFFDVIFKKQKEELNRVKEELDWFIKKFDYRFKDLPWNNSKDSLKRMIIKIVSDNPEK